MDWIEIVVRGRPVPAVRQSRRDKWAQRERVERYHAWRDLVVHSCRAYGLRGMIEPPIEMSFMFGLAGAQCMDLDNLIKGIKDALVKGEFIKDDSWKYIPRYIEPCEVVSLCQYCPKRLKRRDGKHYDDCGKIKDCQFEFAWFRIGTGGDESEAACLARMAAVEGKPLPRLFRADGGELTGYEGDIDG